MVKTLLGGLTLLNEFNKRGGKNHSLRGKFADEELFEDIVAVLLGQANLSDGGELDDPGEFSAKLNKLLLKIN